MKIRQKDNLETTIQSASGEGWKSTDVNPGVEWLSAAFNDSGWENVRNYGSMHWDQLLGFTFEDSMPTYARASLVRQHPFLKALGRPSRENVATSRDDQATLLQSLELTNGAYFNQVLEEGASNWLQQYGSNAAGIVDTLYLKCLGRKPSNKEKDIILSALGDTPDKEGLQDVFWATLLLPEFQFIY
jgi:hypothetical protein